MSINGKRDEFSVEDLEAVARTASLKRGTGARTFEQVREVVRRWPEVAAGVGVSEELSERIAAAQRLALQTSRC